MHTLSASVASFCLLLLCACGAAGAPDGGPAGGGGETGGGAQAGGGGAAGGGSGGGGAPTEPTVTIAGGAVAEGDTGTRLLQLVVTLAPPSPTDVVVTWETRDDTATAGVDYTAASSQTFTFPAGSGLQTISVEVRGDLAVEPDERFVVALLNATGAALGSSALAFGTVTNDDTLPVVSVNDSAAIEGPDAGLRFTLTLSRPQDQAVQVEFAADAGTASLVDWVATAGTASFAAGETSFTLTVPVADDALDEDDEAMSLVLHTPQGVMLGDAVGLGLITDDDAPPGVTVPGSYFVNEDGGYAEVVVQLSAASGRQVQVPWRAVADTATSPEDFVASPTTLTLMPGETSKSIFVTLVDDEVHEADERFRVELDTANLVNVTAGATTVTTVDLGNDDLASISVPLLSHVEGDAGVSALVATLTMSRPSALPHVVTYTTPDAGTATRFVDFTPVSGSLTFAPGELVKTVNVPIVGDLVDEANETFQLSFSSATIGVTQTAPCTIVDDDASPTLSMAALTVTEGSGGGTNPAPVVVTLSHPTSLNVSFTFVTVSGTASAGSDFTFQNVTRTIPAGSTSITINVAIVADSNVEPNETLTIRVQSVANATPSSVDSTLTIVNDD